MEFRTEYFFNIDALRLFLLALKADNIHYEVISYKQKCSKLKVPFYVYQVNYGGDIE